MLQVGNSTAEKQMALINLLLFLAKLGVGPKYMKRQYSHAHTMLGGISGQYWQPPADHILIPTVNTTATATYLVPVR